ncbi:DUF669 domain-containing protein [Weissella minor]|uniref:DUF669 domain-containing protein n=1 Tax=Weissella minor TaxID=1620 RepID=UPI001BAE8F06|nr:DUF669 domain-containing protein [Weissella minor]MBS0950552.1 DUF669 domain-containing protein [Weissella minor]
MAYTHNKANGEGNRSIELAGSYNVRILETSEAAYSQKSNPTMSLNYQVLDGSQAGRVISFDSFTDTTNANWKIDRILNAINFADGQSFQGEGLSGVVQALIGKTIRITTDWVQQSQGKNAGKWYPNVTDYTVYQQSTISETFNDKPRPQENSAGQVTKANDDAFANYNKQNQQGFTPNQMHGAGQAAPTNAFPGGQPVDIPDDQLPF